MSEIVVDEASPKIAEIRRTYGARRLRRADLHADPLEQFALWLNEALSAGMIEPNAMSLATAWKDARPSVRTVLLKSLDSRGFVFYTNLESRKARQLDENPNAALLFPWLALERQVIVTGSVSRVTTSEVTNYFALRPRESQISAWASPQSRAIVSRTILESEWEKMKRKFADKKVPLPPFWGGYRVAPATIEFWQGGQNRLHDRFEYRREPNGSWTIERLAP
jgi:pyridoxamine 5'-phosphate oxidase